VSDPIEAGISSRPAPLVGVGHPEAKQPEASRANANPGDVSRHVVFMARGGGITFAGKMFLTAVRVITAVMLARLLQASQLGLYSMALSMANIGVAVAIFGLDAALVRYVAVLSARRDDKALWGALQLSFGLGMTLSVLTGTLLFALAYPAADLLFGEPALAPLLQLTAVIVPLLTLSELLAGAIRGFKRMDYAALAQFIAQPVIRLVLIALLAIGGLTTAEAIITFGLADLAASFFLLYYLNRVFPLRRKLGDASWDTRAIMNFSVPVWLSDMMVKFHGNFQTLILGSLSSVAGAGIFTVVSQVTLISGQFSSSINVSAKPVIAELHDRRDMDEMNRLYQSANKWAVMVQLPVFLVMLLYPKQILLIFGQSFTDGAAALVILGVSSLILVGTGMGGIILDMGGQTRLKLLNSVLRLATFLALDLLLIPRWGVVGAALAALVGETLVNLLRLGEVYYLYRLLPYNRSFFRLGGAALVALVAALLVGRRWPPDQSLVMTAINAAVLLSVYTALILRAGFTTEEKALVALARRRAGSVIGRTNKERPSQ
jgi:O-antigen/teichoic acid export membrane protein